MNVKDKIKTIWDVPAYLPFIQPKLTDELIVETEKKIGYKLPKEYIEILKIQNGGTIRFRLIEHDFAHSEIWGIGPYYPSIIYEENFEYIEDVSFKLDGLIPFDGDWHWFLCFDYQKNKNNPAITFIDVDDNEKYLVADNFTDYLEMLRIDTDEMFVINTNKPFEEILEYITDKLGIIFVDQNKDNCRDYPLSLGTYKHHYLWFSSNIVPNAFVGKDHERYNELKHLVNSTAVKYLEIPNNAIIVKISALNYVEITSELEKIGLDITHLKKYYQ